MSKVPGPAVVRPAGVLGAHLAAALEQLSRATPYSVDLVTQDVCWVTGQERIFQDYRGDLSGRYLDAMAVAHSQGLPVDREKAVEILRRVLGAQQPDGFFGPPAPALSVDHGSAWGHGRLLDGLLSAREWAPVDLLDDVGRSSVMLAEAIGARAGQWAQWVGDAGKQKFRLDPLSAILPLTRFAETADSKPALFAARTLAEALPADVDGAHMHGYLLALRGRLEVGRLTGSDDMIHDVRRRAETIAESYLLPHGAVLESVTLPWDVNTEACGIADWIMLNLRLHEMFDDHRYMDRATSSAFNGLLHTQRASGHFGCETLAGDDGLLVSDYAPEAWWCCTFHGIRALHHLAEHAVTIDDDVVRVHLPMELEGADAEDTSVISVTGGYPYTDHVTISSGPALQRAALHVRVPSTATLAEVVVDGAVVDDAAADGWIRLPSLPSGARVEIVLRRHEWFSIDGDVAVPPFSNSTTASPDLSAARCAVFRGPLLLAAHGTANSVEDLLRSRYLVHPHHQPRFERDDEGHAWVTATGHDTFRVRLRLAPLAGPDRTDNEHAVRTTFMGLLFSERSIHGSATH